MWCVCDMLLENVSAAFYILLRNKCCKGEHDERGYRRQNPLSEKMEGEKIVKENTVREHMR